VPIPTPRQRALARERATVVRAAAVLGLVWLGDALIYVVLPLHADAFGIGLASVGVVLAVNRVVRILGYGWVASLSRRFGMRALTAAAALGAALSTVAYGVATGLAPLLVARLVWGMAYGILNVTTTAYAIGDGAGAGRRVGLNRAVSTLGPTVALSLGAWMAVALDARAVFVILGTVGLLAVPIALTLPRALAAAPVGGGAAATRWRPSSLNLLFFTNSLIEGVFATTLSLLFTGTLSVSSALLSAGLVLAAQRLLVAVLSVVAGPLVDRLGAHRMLAPCVLAVVAGMLGLAHGALYPAAALVVLARAVLSTTGPVLAASAHGGSTVDRLAAFATWVDAGLAVGPLLAGAAIARAGLPTLYRLCAGALAATLLVHRAAWRRAA
jgi:MFS family permease